MSKGIFGAAGSIATGWGRRGAIALFLGLLLLLTAEPARAQCVSNVCTVATASDLVSALTTIDATPGTYTINITASITLTAGTTLPAITGSANNVTINGGPGITLDGANLQRGFFVYQGSVAINDLTIQNTVAQGGSGGTGAPGGGGAGLGGALFVASGASLSVSNVNLTGNKARGGTGGDGLNSSSGGGGGGGGMGGNGGSNGFTLGSGGGGLGRGADGGGISGGISGIALGAASGGEGASGSGGGGGGGGGGAGGFPGQAGGGGGVAGGTGVSGNAGAGGFGGGGGGGFGGGGGGGGPGGLGGGGGGSFSGTGGAGGFGGGGGGAGFSNSSAGGPGGFGGGTGGGGTSGSAVGGGGGGLGAGGAIFVQQGGTLTLDGPLTVNGNSVTAGLGGAGVGGGSNGAAGTIAGSGMFLQGSGTVTFNPGSGQTQTFSNGIADEAGSGGAAGNKWTVDKTGAGTLVLGGINTYSGDTNVTGGTLSISSNANLGNGGTVALGDGTGITFTAGGTYSHGITVAGDPAFDVGTGLTVTQSGTIADGATPGEVEKTGGGVLVLSAANSYSGGTTIADGTLRVGNDSALGTGAVDLTASGAVLDLNGHTVGTSGLAGVAGSQVTFDAGSALSMEVASGTTESFAGDLVDDGGAITNFVVKSGTGTQTLSGDNSLGGIFSVQEGTLSLDSNTAMSSRSFLEVATGAQATINGVDVIAGELVTTGSGDGTVLLDGGSLTVAGAAAVNTFAGRLTGTGSFLVEGSGLVQTLSGTSDYSGTTSVVAQGTLRAGADNSFSAASAHTVLLGSTLDLAGFDETIGSLAGTGNVTLGAGALTTGGDNSSSTSFSGVISGNGGSLVKAGSGRFTLSGINTYTGGTTVSGGTLSISSDANLGNGGTVALEDGTTLSFTAGGTYSHSITVTGDPTLDVATGQTVTQSAVIANGATPGEVVKTGAGTLVLTAANTYTGGTTVQAGTLRLGASGSLASSGALIVNGGVFDLENGGQIVGGLSGTGGSVILGNGDLTVDQAGNSIFHGVVTGSKGLTIEGGGRLELGNATNDYGGGTTVIEGSTVTIADNGDLGALAGGVTLGDATTSGTLATISAVTSARTITLGAGGGSIDVKPATTATLGGPIGGAGGLTKTNTGTLILTGTEIYTGGTTVTAGTLRLGAGGSLASTGALVVDGGSFDLENGGQTVGSLAGAGVVTLSNGSLTVNQSTTPSTSFAGSIGGTGGLTKSGTGELILTGASTYTGATTVNAGRLLLGSGGSLAATTALIVNGGVFDLENGGQTVSGLAGVGGAVNLGNGSLTLNLDTGTTQSFAGSIGGSGGLIKSGAGLEVLTGASSYTGDTTVNAGTLQLGSGGSLAATTALIVNGGSFDLENGGQTVGSLSGTGGTVFLGSNLTVDQATAASFGGSIGGTGNLSKSGVGTLTLTGSNGYTGVTGVNGGTLELGSGGSLASSTSLFLSGGVFDLENGGQTVAGLTGSSASAVNLGNGSLTVAVDGSTSFGGSIGGTGGLIKSGAGLQSLTGASSYTGATTVNAGTLLLGTNGSLASTTALVVNGGSFDLENPTGQTVGSLSGAAAGTLFLGNGSLTVNQATTTSFAGSIGGTGGLFKSGTGTVILTGTSDYTGTTGVSAGTLELGPGGHLGSTTPLIVTGGVFDLENGGQIVGGLAGFDGAVNLGNGNLTVNLDQDTTASFAGSIGGAGGLVKSGAGLQSLTGANSYTGATEVDAGTLQLGEGGSLASTTALILAGGTFDLENGGQTVGSLSGPSGAVILDDGDLTVDQSAKTDFGGAIGGAGGLTKTGAGLLTLDGASSYTGDTTVDGGTLQLGVGGSLAATTALIVNSGSFDIENGSGQTVGSLSGTGGAILLGNGGLTVNQAGNTSFAGVIGGDGSLTKLGLGTLTLTGASGYTGGTEIDAGKLRLGAGGSLAATGVMTIAGGTFDLNGNDQTLAGLSGSAGAITLGSGDLTVDQAGPMAFNGKISGTGSLTKSGAGLLGLGGDNSYTGGTIVNAGILQLETGGSLASTGKLTVNGGSFDLNGQDQATHALSGTGGTIALGTGTLTVRQSITTSFLGDISGNGGLTKAGPGTLILDGTNSYAGLTSVNNGILEIGDADHTDASLAGPVTIGSEGKLQGHGTIGGDVANASGGVLSPGGSIGTMTVGNYSQGPTSRLLIEVSPTAASQLKVVGNASLAGDLHLVYEPGVYADASYDILNAASVSGSFGSVTGQAPSGFTQSLTYSPTDVTLGLSSGGGPIVVTPTNDTIYTAMSTAALLAAQQANGALLTHMGELHLGTGSPKVQTALASANPTQVAFTGTADQLADLLPAIPQAVGQMGGWFKAIGSFASLDGSITTPGFDTQAGGFLAGFDKAVSANFTVGVAAGYLHTNLSEAGGASGSLDTPRPAVYGTYTLGNLAVDATAGYAYDFINSSRPSATLGQTASSSYNGQEANAALQVSTRANFGGITFMPAAGLAFVHVVQNGVSESGAPGFNLSVNGNSANSLRPFAAITAAKSYTTDGGTVITPEADIAYSYETLATTPPSLIQAGGGSFTVPGLMPSRSQLILGGGITAQLTDTLAFEAAYHIIPPTGNTLSQTISLGLDYRF